MFVTYKQAFHIGKVLNTNTKGKTGHKFLGDNLADVICFPLFGVLKSLNVSKVDYFSLDVEGNEMDVLQTIPFDDLDITVEYYTERQIKVCMWLREISSCSCLTVLPGPPWVLLSKTYKPLFAPL